MGLSVPLLPEKRQPVDRSTNAAALCAVHVTLSMSVPVLSDWIRRQHGGTFAFNIPALTFLAYAFSTVLGASWTVLSQSKGLHILNRPDMIWRFCITAGLFTTGDILSFTAIQRLDAGTFSLAGKAMSMVFTVILTRLFLSRQQAFLDYCLLVAIAGGTTIFCQQELQARLHGQMSQVEADWEWLHGLAQRLLAVLLTSFAAVMQECLLTREPGIPFMLQQAWMGCGALTTSFLGMKLSRTLPTENFFRGFDDWKVLILLAFYVAHGFSAGLMVKHLGALARALCVPITLGGCYTYAVFSGSASLSLGVVAAWLSSAGLIGTYAVSKAKRHKVAKM